MARSLNHSLYERAARSLVGGVNSPVRSFRSVGVQPIIAASARGAYLYDAYGRRYLDFIMSWGAIILGHAHREVEEAIREALSRGTSYGLTTAAEIELAEEIRGAFPSMELVRLVNSGTEAAMSAVRIARAFTGRNKAIVFEGGYHGHSDGFLVKAGSGLSTLGLPASAGVPGSIAADTLVARYNDLKSVEELIGRHPGEIACVLLEPVAGNMGVVPPAEGFLHGLRRACDHSGALLIFDEVISGFRISFGGAQEAYCVRPDLTILGKIIGGGLPIGAFGGRRGVMEQLAPLGPAYQAGTLAGNPIAVSAGLAAIRSLRRQNPYEQLVAKAQRMQSALEQIASVCGVPLRVNRVGPMLSAFFAAEPVTDYASVQRASAGNYAHFFRSMLEQGVLLPPSPYETWFPSLAHTDRDLDEFERAAQRAIAHVARVLHGSGKGECLTPMGPTGARDTPLGRSASPRNSTHS